MGLFGNNKKTGGIFDVIRCDEPSYLIWKWHPVGTQLGENRRENAIRWGSSLRVRDGSVAVFVYNQKDGPYQEFFEGPYDQIIKTNNFPILSNIIGKAYDAGTPFQAEVYFINLAIIIQTKFAVPFFNVFDPRYLDFGVPTAVRGTISFKIEDYKEFIKLHRLDNFNLDNFQDQIKDAVIRYVKDAVANAPINNDIPVIQIERKTIQITEMVEAYLKARLRNNFGVVVSGVDIGAIEIDKTSDGYNQLIAVTKDLATAAAQAKTAVNIKDMHDKQRIEAENYQEVLRIQREEGQYAQRKQSQTANIAAFQVEAQKEVGIAGANALGQMGANDAGSMSGNISGGGGFNPAAMMASMAVGGAVGQNIAGAMNNMMAGVNQSSQAGATPPPIPTAGYKVNIGGQPSGPYDITALMQMAIAGLFVASTLVWKEGMNDWVPADCIDELKTVFSEMPPVPPSEDAGNGEIT